jgi:hypothetical protein
MIYTSPSFWKNHMGDSQALADAGYKTLWVAHWGVSAPAVPARNWGGRGWTFWQYTSDGTVPGIAGRVDLDKFNGLDLTPQAYSAFSLTASAGSVKQGASSTATVSIKRTNFTSGVTLQIAGLPDGTTATFAANPATATSTTLTMTTPADPAATPVGTYPLTITGVAQGITRTTKANLVVSDGIAPTVVAPTTSLVASRTLGTTSVPAKVSWSASDPSGISAHGLQRSLAGGSWTTLKLATTTSTSIDQSLPIGTSQQRARSTDAKGNTSAWTAGPVVRAALFQQSSSSVRYSGTWTTASAANASGGSIRHASSAGAAATFTFTGSSVAWVATQGTSRGQARVYVDGVYAATVSTYASSGHSKAIVFARNFGAVGPHTLRVVVVGTAGHPRVEIDAFVRLSIS